MSTELEMQTEQTEAVLISNDHEKAWHDGYSSYDADETHPTSPYEKNSIEAECWFDGWEDAAEDVEQTERKTSANELKVTSGSYSPDDVTFLIKLLDVQELSAEEKERALQSGEKHYSEIIAQEYSPTEEYMDLFHRLVKQNGQNMADALVTLASHMNDNRPDEITIISLMRAGTPVGVLLKRILETRFGREVKHYSISIVRDRGIDTNALDYILKNENRKPSECLFVDGWTAKGVITRELKHYVNEYNISRNTDLSDTLYVLSDIGGTADVTASFDDYAIPSGVLNSTVSGLLSRSIWNDDIGLDDFHGAKYYSELEADDYSQKFIDDIMALCVDNDIKPAQDDKDAANIYHQSMMTYVSETMARFNETDINMIKPGIAEATRVMLRRIPRVLIVRDVNDVDTKHVVQLAKDKGVPIEIDAAMPIKAVSMITNMKGND
jgi:hypothetical protein